MKAKKNIFQGFNKILGMEFFGGRMATGSTGILLRPINKTE